jgi:hypothetical protein
MNAWSTFVRSVVSRCERGESSGAISSTCAGESVLWEGVVSAIRLDEEYAPGVEMEMEMPVEWSRGAA